MTRRSSEEQIGSRDEVAATCQTRDEQLQSTTERAEKAERIFDINRHLGNVPGQPSYAELSAALEQSEAKAEKAEALLAERDAQIRDLLAERKPTTSTMRHRLLEPSTLKAQPSDQTGGA